MLDEDHARYKSELALAAAGVVVGDDGGGGGKRGRMRMGPRALIRFHAFGATNL